jgi:hypothetical protein
MSTANTIFPHGSMRVRIKPEILSQREVCYHFSIANADSFLCPQVA